MATGPTMDPSSAVSMYIIRVGCAAGRMELDEDCTADVGPYFVISVNKGKNKP